MIAPKINGQFMSNGKYNNDWEFCINGLVINVYCLEGTGDENQSEYNWSVEYNEHYLPKPMGGYSDSAQGAADKAVKFLHGLRNVINLLK